LARKSAFRTLAATNLPEAGPAGTPRHTCGEVRLPEALELASRSPTIASAGLRVGPALRLLT